jgi:hypothetical protein
MKVRLIACVSGCLWFLQSLVGFAQATPPIELQRDDRQGQLRVLIDGREAFVYQYGADLDFPHYYPVRSPSGKPLTVQYADDKHSHHRSIWINDIVQPPNHDPISFYAIGLKEDSKRTDKGFRDCIRHVKFLGEEVSGGKAIIKTQHVVPLGKGEYLLDLRFEVKASYGDMTFVSEWNHYSWPYVRMHSLFDVKRGGGTVTNSLGGINEQGTNEKRAHWVDCSNRVEGVAEGLAFFAAADGGEPPLWLVRDYGTFGPRRPDAQSGVKFVLKKDESLKQHVGFLIHSGDVTTGRVAQRYQQFVKGAL